MGKAILACVLAISIAVLAVVEARPITKAAGGLISLRREMRNPDSFRLEWAAIAKEDGSLCYQFRSQNGWGGMGRGYAILPAGKTVIQTSDTTQDQDAFKEFWVGECLSKQTSDVTAVLKALPI